MHAREDELKRGMKMGNGKTEISRIAFVCASNSCPLFDGPVLLYLVKKFVFLSFCRFDFRGES